MNIFNIRALACVLLSAGCVARGVAHMQHVHQYIVREGYNLLKGAVGEIPVMKDHVGLSQTGDRAWHSSFIVAGAWREDLEDPVYEYQSTWPPGVEGTHFWRADMGDESDVTFRWITGGVVSTCTVPSSYRKIRRYASPAAYGPWKLLYVYDHAMINAFPCGPPLIAAIALQYDDLVTFFKTGAAYQVGYIGIDALYHSCEPRVAVTLGDEWRNRIVWEVLGRMCHLLEDLSIPAHAHGDAHGICDSPPLVSGLGYDTYETWVGSDGAPYNSPYTAWNGTNSGGLINPYVAVNPLHYLLYTMQQISDHFGSNGCYDGDGNDISPYAAAPYEFLRGLLPGLGQPVAMAQFSCCSDVGLPGCYNREGTSLANRTNIRDKTLPYCIRAVAGLLYWFAVESELITSTIVKNDFNAGTVRVNGSEYPSGIRLPGYRGSTIRELRAFTQFCDGYWRIPKIWQKMVGTQIVSTHRDSVWTDVPVNENATYVALFTRLINVSLVAPAFAEPGSGGSYEVNGTPVGSTWNTTMREDSGPFTVKALAPGAEWLFGYWSDGATANPYLVHPSGHTALQAVFKRPLCSTSRSVTAPNWQHKALRDAAGRLHLVYEAANAIWYCRSTDGGASWLPEKYLSGGHERDINQRPTLTLLETNAVRRIIVLWESYSSGSYILCSRAIDAASGEAGAIEDFIAATGNVPQTASTMPALSCGASTEGLTYILAAWYDRSTNTIEGRVRNESGAWLNQVRLRSGPVSSFALSPVCRAFTAGSGSTSPSAPVSVPWDLVWYDGSAIYYSSIPVSPTPAAHQAELVAPATEAITARSPVVVNYGGTIGVAWREYPDGFQGSCIKYRERLGSNSWSPVTVWAPNPKIPGRGYQAPVVAAYPSSRDVRVAWLYGSDQIQYVTRKNGTWSAISALATGVDPMPVVGYAPVSIERVVYSGLTSPFPIQSATISGGTLMSLSAAAESHTARVGGRGGRLAFPRGLINLAVLSGTKDGAQISFVPFCDTVAIRTIPPYLRALTSEPFEGRGTLNLTLLYGCSGVMPQGASIRLQLLDASTRRPLSVFPAIDADTLLRLTVSFNFGQRPVVLALVPSIGREKPEMEVEQWIIADQDDAFTLRHDPRRDDAAVSLSLIPQEYALHQNYPNPFNPSTRIDYDLPKGGTVSLMIHDVLGRTVAELDRGFREAGSYSEVWEGRNSTGSRLASGIYFVRLIVTDETGTVKFSKVNRLHLMK